MEYIPILAIAPHISGAIKQAFSDIMKKEYSLIYTDYNDNYDESGKKIQSCLDNNDADAIDNDWVSERVLTESLRELNELKESILSDDKYKQLHPYIENWLEESENQESILNAIEERDTSTPIAEMMARTRLRGRATLYTNYDCLPHNFDMNNTYYYDDYFKDIVDVLCLNPAMVKEVFDRKGINTIGEWPDIPERDKQEAVKYEDLADELMNQCCYGLLTFMGMLPLNDLFKHNFEEYTMIVVPKGNNCGMFNDWNGGGSLMEMTLLRDLHIPVTFPNKTQHDKCSLFVDEPKSDNGYCIDEVYGLVSSAWGEEFNLIYKSDNK